MQEDWSIGTRSSFPPTGFVPHPWILVLGVCPPLRNIVIIPVQMQWRTFAHLCTRSMTVAMEVQRPSCSQCPCMPAGTVMVTTHVHKVANPYLALRRAWFEASKSYYLQEVLILTWNAALSPPLSAMFSPSVRFPLIYKFMTSREQNMPMISSILQKSTHIVSKRLILGVLSCKALLSFFECCDGLICPPGPEVTSFVISLACMDMHDIHVVYARGNESVCLIYRGPATTESHWGVTHQ